MFPRSAWEYIPDTTADEWFMKVIYNSEIDTLTVIFSDLLVAESDEDKPGFILDYDETGKLVSLEILDASQRVQLPTQIEYQLVPPVQARQP